MVCWRGTAACMGRAVFKLRLSLPVDRLDLSCRPYPAWLCRNGRRRGRSTSTRSCRVFLRVPWVGASFGQRKRIPPARPLTPLASTPASTLALGWLGWMTGPHSPSPSTPHLTADSPAYLNLNTIPWPGQLRIKYPSAIRHPPSTRISIRRRSPVD